MKREDLWDLNPVPSDPQTFIGRVRAAVEAWKQHWNASPTGWRCPNCGGTESMFESMDPEDPTVEICKRCGYKDRY